jgi:hypothetical protein
MIGLVGFGLKSHRAMRSRSSDPNSGWIARNSHGGRAAVSVIDRDLDKVQDDLLRPPSRDLFGQVFARPSWPVLKAAKAAVSV